MAIAREFLPELSNPHAPSVVADRRIARFAPFLRERQRGGHAFDWQALNRTTAHLDVRLETDTGILWVDQKHGGRPCFSPGLLHDILELQATLQRAAGDPPPGRLPVRYLVWASTAPQAWNLGGDLRLFTDLIRARDGDGLHRYAKACVDVCYLNATSMELPILTIALVQGDALGGGFEAVLTNDLVIAEAGVKFGLPEVLFNLFPGMGAYSFLCRKLTGSQARSMIQSGRLYPAEELFELGLVDQVVPVGEGEAALRAHIARNDRRHGVLTALARVDRRCQPVTYDELLEVTDIWVETALGLSELDLRRMEHLARAQERRSRARTATMSEPIHVAAE
jgi:DSF synthase